MIFKKIISQTFILSLISLFAISSFGVNTNAQISPQNEIKVLNEINKNRSQNNLKPLNINEKLNKTASFYAQNLAQNNYISHKGLDGQNASDRITKFGYNWTTFGENIAAGSDNPTITVERWMQSSGHKANILNSEFCEIGIGYGYNESSNYKHYWTVNFGCRDDFNSNEVKETSETKEDNAENTEIKKVPAIRAHYPYNPTTQLIKSENSNSKNTPLTSQIIGQDIQLNKVKVFNFQSCKDAGGQLSDFTYNSKNLVKCSISSRHFAVLS